MFQNTLTDEFICVNTRLGFDTEIFLSDHSKADFNKINFDKSFKAFKRQGLKTVYKLKLDGENSCSNRRVISKILKLNENNQYGHAMTRPLPTACMEKQESIPSRKKFNRILETANLEDTIAHLFVVSIKFNFNKSNVKTLMYKEIY